MSPAPPPHTPPTPQPVDAEETYSVLCDTFDLSTNTALLRWKTAHPELVPPNDVGRALLPILVQRLCRLLLILVSVLCVCACVRKVHSHVCR